MATACECLEPETPQHRMRVASEKIQYIQKMYKEMPNTLYWELLPAAQDALILADLEWREAFLELQQRSESGAS